jgi:hypothetical protein
MEDMPFTVKPKLIGPAVRIGLNWVHGRSLAGLAAGLHQAVWQRDDMPLANGVYGQSWSASFNVINDGEQGTYPTAQERLADDGRRI